MQCTYIHLYIHSGIAGCSDKKDAIADNESEVGSG